VVDEANKTAAATSRQTKESLVIQIPRGKCSKARPHLFFRGSQARLISFKHGVRRNNLLMLLLSTKFEDS